MYLLQRGHFALAMGWAITLYEDCSQMSPPVKESVIAEREAGAVGKTLSCSHEQPCVVVQESVWNGFLTFQVNQKGPFYDVCI